MVPQTSTTPLVARSRAGQVFDLAAWIATHQLPVVQQKPWNEGQLWVLNPCPWNADHTNNSARIVQFPNGAIAAGCFHNGCAGNDWHALRDRYEPGWRDADRASALPEAVQQLLSTLQEDRNPDHVFDAVEALAALAPSQWGKIKAQLKALLGDKLNLNDLDRAVSEARRQHSAFSDLPGHDGLPVIEVHDRPLRAISEDTLAALIQANSPPTLFVRERALTRSALDDNNRPILEALSEAHVRGVMTRTANFVVRHKDRVSHVLPPREVAQDLLVLGEYPGLPLLKGLTEVPLLRPDGTILDQPGFDAATQLLYCPPPGFVLPPIPAAPSQAEARQALDWLITELLSDFPFVLDAHGLPAESASRTSALGLLFTFLLRAMIPGPVPLAVVEAPRQGTGKGLLVSALTLLATGQETAVRTAPVREEEWAKVLTATLLAGTPICLIDNVLTLNSATFAALLTASSWEDRLLGASRMVRLPHRTVWICTGNNIDLGGDRL